jgi:hypothetical protein
MAHNLSNSVENIYKKAPDFIELKADVARIITENLTGKHCFLATPNIRTKSRYSNIYTIAD